MNPSTHALRGKPLDAIVGKFELGIVRGVPVRFYRVMNEGWFIDSTRAGHDEKAFGQPIGPFETLEGAWLALQILKD